ncbi:MAG TPA: hypothetical protein VFB66_09720 [Tepidisphaeraceae bacterium]|nr:hypothetical protein [Tepidisphaeraceae bacterium]
MSVQPTIPWFILLVPGLLALAAGLLLVRRGLRGRRLGDTPHCRKCDYALVGIDSGRCPECGTELGPRTIVRGERVRTPAFAWVGVILLAAGAALTWAGGAAAYRTVNWYALRPTSWVIDDAGSPNAAVAARGWAELERRMKAAPLSAANRRRLAELGLTEQAAATPRPHAHRAVEWLGREVVAGQIDPDQKERFFRQMLRVTLRTRPTVVLGDDIAYRTEYSSRVPAGGTWWLELQHAGAWLDGKQVHGASGSSGFSGIGAAGASGSTVPCKTPGEHTVSVKMKAIIRHGPDAANDRSTPPLISFDVDLSDKTNVVTQEPPGYLKHVEEPGLAERLRACFDPKGFEQNPRDISGEVKVTAVPAGLAMDVFARAGGTEYPMGGMTILKGNSTNYYLRTQKYDGPRVNEIDLVLRSNPKLARHTVDMNEAWAGELVIEKVPVKQVK